IVIATQNPIDMEGTYALPEAQRDRFLTRISLAYPATADEVDLLDNQIQNDPLESATAVTNLEHIVQARSIVRHVSASRLLRAAKARAALSGRTYATPDDVQALAPSILAHRIIPRDGDDSDLAAELIGRVLARVPVSNSQ